MLKKMTAALPDQRAIYDGAYSCVVESGIVDGGIVAMAITHLDEHKMCSSRCVMAMAVLVTCLGDAAGSVNTCVV